MDSRAGASHIAGAGLPRHKAASGGDEAGDRENDAGAYREDECSGMTQIAKCLNCNKDYDLDTQPALCPHMPGGPTSLPPWPKTLSDRASKRLLADMKQDEVPWPLPRQVDGHPRRCRVDLATPVESAIRDARQMVEAMPADVRLTDATVALGTALDRVADYLEDVLPSN